MVAGVGLGAALVYLLAPAKRRPRGESTCNEAAGDARAPGDVTGYSYVGDGLVRQSRVEAELL